MAPPNWPALGCGAAVAAGFLPNPNRPPDFFFGGAAPTPVSREGGGVRTKLREKNKREMQEEDGERCCGKAI